MRKKMREYKGQGSKFQTLKFRMAEILNLKINEGSNIEYITSR